LCKYHGAGGVGGRVGDRRPTTARSGLDLGRARRRAGRHARRDRHGLAAAGRALLERRQRPRGGRGRVRLVDAEEWTFSLNTSVPSATAGRVAWPPQPCATDEDCSLNGVCDGNNLCRCDVAWTGDRCQTLVLEPTTRTAGLRETDAGGANVSTWGGAVVLNDAATPPIFHMWASEMAGGCGIQSWRTNSRIIHATSTDGVHFERKELVFEAFAHEPTGEWVMWYTGADEAAPPPPPCTQCADGNTFANASCPTPANVSSLLPTSAVLRGYSTWLRCDASVDEQP